jgi:hypothetical protein
MHIGLTWFSLVKSLLLLLFRLITTLHHGCIWEDTDMLFVGGMRERKRVDKRYEKQELQTNHV